MSLVNDMLRDLHKRERQPRDTRIEHVFGGGDEKSEKRFLPLLAVALGGLLLGGAGGFVLLDRETEPAEPASFIPASAMAGPAGPAEEPGVATGPSGLDNKAASAAEPPEPVAAAPVTAAEVVALNSRSSGQGQRVSLALTAPVEHRVLSESGRSLVVLLPATRAREGVPVTNGEGLRLEPEARGLKVALVTGRDAEFRVYPGTSPDGATLVIEAAPRARTEQVSQTEPEPTAPAPAVDEKPMQASDAAEAGPGKAPTEPRVLPDRAENGMAAGAPGNGPLAGSSEPGFPAPALTPVARRESGEGVKTQREPTFEERDRGISRAAVDLARRGRLLEAYENLLSFIEEHPEAHRSRETLATLLMSRREFQQAGAVLARGLELAPRHAGYKKLQARLLLAGDHAGEALDLMKNMTPSLEEDPEYHDLLASLHQRAGEHEEAVAIYRGLLRRDPGEGRWWAALAISLEALERHREALASYRKALQSEDLEPRVRRHGRERVRVLSK